MPKNFLQLASFSIQFVKKKVSFVSLTKFYWALLKIHFHIFGAKKTSGNTILTRNQNAHEIYTIITYVNTSF